MVLSLRRCCMFAVLLPLVITASLTAQVTGTLSGTVLDIYGQRIPGATVRIVGTTKGAISKADGSFVVQDIRAGEYQIQLTAVGQHTEMYTVRINVGNTTTLQARFRRQQGFFSTVYHPADTGLVVYMPRAPHTVTSSRIRAYRITDPINFFGIGDGRANRFARTILESDSGRLVEWDRDYTLVAEWTLPAPITLHDTTPSRTVPIPMRAPGTYVVTMMNEGISTYTVVVISRYNMVLKNAPGRTLAFVVDSRTGRRVTEMGLSCIRMNGQRDLAMTGFDGTHTIEYSDRDYYSSHTTIAGEHNGNLVIGRPASLYTSEQPYKLHLQTDRPVYRPGQKVHYRGILRRSTRRGYEIPRTRPVHVTVLDPNNRQILADTVQLSTRGTFSGTLELSSAVSLGTMRLQANMDIGYDIATFSVQEYRKPEFTVNVEPRQRYYRGGDTIRATVKARYLFGAPVAHGTVEYQVIRALLRPASGTASAFKAADYAPRTVETRSITIRPDGTCDIVYAPGASDGNDYSYRISANVTDASRRTITGTTDMLATESDLVVHIGTDRNYYANGERAHIAVAVERYDGGRTAVPFTVTAYAATLSNTRAPNAEVKKDPTLKKTRRGTTPGLWSATGRTDSAGHAVLECDVPDAGVVEFRVEVLDGSGRACDAACTTFVPGPRLEKAIADIGHVRVIPERNRWNEGETIRALLITPVANTDVLLTAEGGKLHGHRVERVSERYAEISYPLPSRYLPNFLLGAAMVANGVFSSDSAPITVTPVRTKMSLTVTSSRRRNRPGDSAVISVRALDLHGRPVPGAEIAMGMVDEALYNIMPDNTPSLFPHFYGTGSHNVNTTYSTGYREEFSRIAYLRVAAYSESEIGMAQSLSREDIFSSSRQTIQGAVALQSGVTTAGVNGFTIRGGRGDETMVRVDGIDISDPFTGGFGMQAEAAPITEAVPGEQFAATAMRADFRDLMVWHPALLTDADGYARLPVRFPDNITAWRVTVAGITDETQVGNATTVIEVSKDLLVRMELPRFVVNGDSMLVATTVHNYLPAAKRVTVRLSGERANLAGHERVVTIPANGEQRVDWPVKVDGIDSTTLVVRALSDEESDAMTRTIPILPRGFRQTAATSASLGGGAHTTLMKLEIPAASDPVTRSITISLSPSVASSMVGALDDLVGYPYGCVEQTMSRFLPTIVTADVLKRLRAPFSEQRRQELPAMVRAGTERLFGFQHTDGGWGWWHDDATHPFMTAYVMYGLAVARSAGYPIPENIYQRGTQALLSLIRNLPRNSGAAQVPDPTTEAYMLYVASYITNEARTFRDRIAQLSRQEDINSYTVALLALAARCQSESEIADRLAERLKETAIDSGAGIHWAGKGWHYRWQDDYLETSAFAVKALVGTPGMENAAEDGIRWLQAQRRGSSWGSTRQSAMVVYAIADYLRSTVDATSGFTTTVWLNGIVVHRDTIEGEDLFLPDRRITLRGVRVRDGVNNITVKKDGDGLLQATAWSECYLDMESVQPASAGFRVEREYFRLERTHGRDGWVFEKEPFEGTVRSGDELLVKVTIACDSLREYFLLEEPLPAGCEVVENTSGYHIKDEREYRPGRDGSNDRPWYSSREVHDQRIAFFAGQLRPGNYTFTYILRAQIPGRFGVLPSLGMLNYFPDVRGNGSPELMTILE